MNIFIPFNMIIKAHRTKYKYLAIPILVILINFALSLKNEALYIPAISIIAFAFFLFIMYLFRFKRSFSQPDDDVIFAPMNGKIVQIKPLLEGHVLTIKKPFLASSEFVTCSKCDALGGVATKDKAESLDIELLETQTNVFWKVKCALAHIFINETIDHQAVLIGIVPGNAVCEVFLPQIYDLKVKEGSEVSAGFSELGNLKGKTFV